MGKTVVVQASRMLPIWNKDLSFHSCAMRCVRLSGKAGVQRKEMRGDASKSK